jgi:hypothetical protein
MEVGEWAAAEEEDRKGEAGDGAEQQEQQEKQEGKDGEQEEEEQEKQEKQKGKDGEQEEEEQEEEQKDQGQKEQQEEQEGKDGEQKEQEQEEEQKEQGQEEQQEEQEEQEGKGDEGGANCKHPRSDEENETSKGEVRTVEQTDEQTVEQTVDFRDADDDSGSFRLCNASEILQLWYTDDAGGAHQLRQPNLSIVVYDSETGEVSVGSEGSVLGGSFVPNDHVAVMQKVKQLCRSGSVKFEHKAKQRIAGHEEAANNRHCRARARERGRSVGLEVVKASVQS